MVIEYRLAETRAAQVRSRWSSARSSGRAPADGVKPEFVLTANTDTWQRLGRGELPASKAMVTRKVKFRGPMSVALANLPSLEAAMKMMGQIDGTDWSV